MKNVMIEIELNINFVQLILLELPTLILLRYVGDLTTTKPARNAAIFGDLVTTQCIVERNSNLHKMLLPRQDCLIVKTRGNHELSRVAV